MKKIIWILLLAIIILVQFIPSGRTGNVENNPDDLILTADVPEEIAQLLKTSCYDCHSNQTDYPWYSYVAPVSWLVSRDVREGRENLNFSVWGGGDKMQMAKMLTEIMEEVEEKEMPLGIYTIIHRKAKLGREDRQAIVDWTNEYGESLFGE